jgi:putative flippase GtrA
MHPAIADTLSRLPKLYDDALRPHHGEMAIAVAASSALVAAGCNALAAFALVLTWFEYLCHQRWSFPGENTRATLMRALACVAFAWLSTAQGVGDAAWGLGAFILVQTVLALRGSLKLRASFLRDVAQASPAVPAHELLLACRNDRALVESWLGGDESQAALAQTALNDAGLRLFRLRSPAPVVGEGEGSAQ